MSKNQTPAQILDEEAIGNLAGLFDVLIEMDLELKDDRSNA